MRTFDNITITVVTKVKKKIKSRPYLVVRDKHL